MKAKLVIGSILLLTAGMSYLGYLLTPYNEPPSMAFLFGFMTLLIVGGITYLVYYTKSMNKLDLPDDELADKEIVWAKTPQSMVHYRTGNPLKFWEGVGGKLFLTNEVLEFRANPAEYWVYRITIPLRDVRHAAPQTVLGFIRGGLRVVRNDGTFELFTFGAAFDLSCEWANAIMEFRDDIEESEHPSH